MLAAALVIPKKAEEPEDDGRFTAEQIQLIKDVFAEQDPDQTVLKDVSIEERSNLVTVTTSDAFYTVAPPEKSALSLRDSASITCQCSAQVVLKNEAGEGVVSADESGAKVYR